MQNIIEKLKVQEKQWCSIDTRKASNRCENVVSKAMVHQIEKEGITTEILEALNKTFPIFTYKTQVTVHGLFPEVKKRSYGYKNLITNKNGSLGIRYSAIDADKKVKIGRFVSLAGQDYGSFRNSSIFYVYRAFGRIEKAGTYKVTREFILKNYETGITWAKSLDSSLFNGVISWGHHPLTGVVYVTVTVNSIAKDQVTPFVEMVTGKSKDELNCIYQDKKAQREKERKEREIKAAQYEAEKEKQFKGIKEADTRTDFNPDNLKLGQGVIVEEIRNLYGISKDFYAVFKNAKGILVAYEIYGYEVANHKINTRKRTPAPLRKWAKDYVLVKIVREGLNPNKG